MPTNIMTRLLAGTAVSALLTGAAFAADANARPYDIPQQDTATALQAYAMQSGKQVLFPYEAVKGKQAPQIKGDYSDSEVLALLAGSAGLRVTADDGKTVTLRPQAAAAGEGGSDAGTVQALIVTAQKREENIQDVPIAMSAFTQEALERSQVAGGPDLMTQVPNMTFTKTNFSSYSIQIRGIGTQAISATTDPAVAVAFNNTPFVRNRFFEQEFYDLERIEVLRGPQGTLYGRNATAGVVNIISAKPKFIYEAKLSGDVSNYNSTRFEGMINVPLVEDVVALRLAGAWTKRDGFVTNQITGHPIDGRDLWSARASLRLAPTDGIEVNLIYEHFDEDDDRLRSGKQLCKTHTPTQINGVALDTTGGGGGILSEIGTFSQGCQAVSLYSPEAFQVPNGWSLPYYHGLMGIGLPLFDTNPNFSGIQPKDPYASTTQSRDLRVIDSTVDPDYRARSNVFELQAKFDVTDSLTLTSETSYSTDELFSMQDLNRFNTTPGAFANSAAERVDKYPNYNLLTPGPNGGGIFCDPQIGCSDRLVALDLSTADSRQFSQELRLGSSFDGPFNFSVGANLLRYDTMDKYYVFINTIALTALNNPFWNAVNPAGQPPQYEMGVTDNLTCYSGGQGAWLPPDPGAVLPLPNCLYIDPNPIGALNDEGHNYFLSKNPYKLISYATFGEVYYQLAENLKITGGLRLTIDKKSAPRIPSMLLAADSIGYTVETVVDQKWTEPTGRLAIDWKPDLSFTDETLIYASFAHGYKAGGANPPPTAVITYGSVGAAGRLSNYAIFPRTFDPEFVDAFELGAKNTLLDGGLTLNAAAFYYDYKNYQISEIVDRAALNRNFDADVWGLELEADWRPTETLHLSFKGGYEKTRIADGEQAIDLMDRTAGDPNWVVVKPFPASTSNCVMPAWLAAWHGDIFTGADSWGACAAIQNGVDPVTLLPYVANPTLRLGNQGSTTTLFDSWNNGKFPVNYWLGYPGYDPTSANNSQGIYKQLGGNELPNAPNFTVTVSADYTRPLPNDWLLTLHSDLHWQSKSYWRVFNDLDYDKLKPYATMNLAAILANEETGWNIMAYVKNVTDETALTGAFLFSDDTGLTTNVFLTEPRLYGLRVTKAWSGGSLLGNFGGRHQGPYPFTLELGGQTQRQTAPYDKILPSFAGDFSPVTDPLDVQNRDLDWGDGRSVKLVYDPGDRWRASLAARFGKTNASDKAIRSEFGGATCVSLGLYDTYLHQGCIQHPETYNFSVDNYSNTSVVSNEDHTIVDFDVRRDVGIGMLADMGIRSEIGVGLRYAQIDSRTDVHIRGVPQWSIPPYEYAKYAPFSFVKYQTQHTVEDARIAAARKFRGAGPVLSWEGSRALLGNADAGHLDLDASLAAGVLFGKQKTRVNGSEVSRFYDNLFPYGEFVEPDATTTTSIAVSRSKSVAVPVVDLSLGLSYQLDRFEIGAGYRWERYFNVVDGGYSKHDDADRTIDGPYFKIAVGFGG